MDDFDLKSLKSDVPGFSSQIRVAYVRGQTDLLRNQSEAWRQACLPCFAAMAAQLRRDSARHREDARPRLALALQFEELAAQPPYEEFRREGDQ